MSSQVLTLCSGFPHLGRAKEGLAQERLSLEAFS